MLEQVSVVRTFAYGGIQGCHEAFGIARVERGDGSGARSLNLDYFVGDSLGFGNFGCGGVIFRV